MLEANTILFSFLFLLLSVCHNYVAVIIYKQQLYIFIRMHAEFVNRIYIYLKNCTSKFHEIFCKTC